MTPRGCYSDIILIFFCVEFCWTLHDVARGNGVLSLFLFSFISNLFIYFVFVTNTVISISLSSLSPSSSTPAQRRKKKINGLYRSIGETLSKMKCGIKTYIK